MPSTIPAATPAAVELDAVVMGPPAPPASWQRRPERERLPERRHDRSWAVGGRRTGFRGLLREVEVEWLGQITPPLAERMEAERWNPDPVERYCWRCGATVGPHEGNFGGCPRCGDERVPWDRLVRLGSFEGLLREMVHEVKYTHWRRLGDDLGRLLGQSLAEEMKSAGLRIDRTVLVPVPTSFWRRLKRGIDHPLVIARGISRETGLRIVTALAKKHRPTQQSLPASRRAANIRGAIAARSRATRLAGLNVVLVDDVTTTRSTMAAAARVVRKMMTGTVKDRAKGEGESGAAGGGPGQIWAAVLAVTPELDEVGRGAGGVVEGLSRRVNGDGVNSR
jgi:predicted amidophosphoribosyltransferase